MHFREVLFNGDEQRSTGKLFLHSMPGRFEAWADFVEHCQRSKIKQILCLTTANELKEMSPDYYQAIHSSTLPAKFNACAVPDFSTPKNLEEYRRCIEAISAKILSGDNVLIHCAAGIGRTGTAAACILASLSVPADQAVILVESAGSKAETNKQQAFINRFAAQFKTERKNN